MAVYAFRTSSFARDIYLYGNRGFGDIPAEYVEPVKEYAGTNFSVAQIDNALAKTWITQDEYNDTMAYRV